MKLLKFSVFTLFYLLFSSCSQDFIESVKNGELSDYPMIKVGTALENFMGPCLWEEIVAEDGSKYVNVTGSITFYDKPSTAVLQIMLIDDNNFKVNALEIDGEAQNALMISALVEKSFKSTGSANSSEVNKYIKLGDNALTNLERGQDEMFQVALDNYNKATVLQPENDDIYRKIALVYWAHPEEPDYDQADKYFRKALEINSKNSEALYNWGKMLYISNLTAEEDPGYRRRKNGEKLLKRAAELGNKDAIETCEMFGLKVLSEVEKIALNAAATVAMAARAYGAEEYENINNNDVFEKKIHTMSCGYGGSLYFNQDFKVNLPDDFRCDFIGNEVVVTHISGQNGKAEWKW